MPDPVAAIPTALPLPAPARRQSLVVGVLRGAAAAMLAGVAVIMLASPLFSDIAPAWLGESVEAGVVAALWMLAGLHAARPHQLVPGMVTYTLGTGAAWFLARGIVHSTSVYYGLVPIVAACAGGTIAWVACIATRREEPVRRRVALATAYGVALTTLVLAAILWDAPLGYLRRVTPPGKETMLLPLHRPDARAGAWYVWSPADVDLAATDSGPVHIETSPGSGSAAFTVEPVTDPGRVTRACAGFRADAASTVDRDVERGNVPAIVARMPARYPSCERGRVWIAREP